MARSQFKRNEMATTAVYRKNREQRPKGLLLLPARPRIPNTIHKPSRGGNAWGRASTYIHAQGVDGFSSLSDVKSAREILEDELDEYDEYEAPVKRISKAGDPLVLTEEERAWMGLPEEEEDAWPQPHNTVSLLDMAKPAKRPAALKGFELVDRVRPVIVLDDDDFEPVDGESDDQFEMVDMEYEDDIDIIESRSKPPRDSAQRRIERGVRTMQPSYASILRQGQIAHTG